MRVACMIPTYNGVTELKRLMASLLIQSAQFDVVIVDSSSTDGTAEWGQAHAQAFKSICAREFNHGGTRQMLVDQFQDYEILVFLTQDAELATSDAIERVVANFDDPLVGAVCARQLPHTDANIYATHARRFNYPVVSRVADHTTISNLGLKSAFMSNSFAAYRRGTLMKVGGFPSNVILAEDMFVAARMVLSGYKVSYDAAVLCRHSHNYTLIQEFRRYFDLGVFHAREPWIRAKLGGAGGEGLSYVISELRFLGLRRLSLWPGSLWRNFLKLVGYKLGQIESRLPVSAKKKMSMHQAFWL